MRSRWRHKTLSAAAADRTLFAIKVGLQIYSCTQVSFIFEGSRHFHMKPQQTKVQSRIDDVRRIDGNVY